MPRLNLSDVQQELVQEGLIQRPVIKGPTGTSTAISYSPNVKKMEFRDFNESLGNPYSRITDKRVPITPYQQEYHDSINKYNMIILDKTKKGGFTDAFLRHSAIETFDHYAGHEILFMAGNSSQIALDLLDRFNLLFEDENGFTDYDGKKWGYGDLISDVHRSLPMNIMFTNGTKAIFMPASKNSKAQSVRGLSDVAMWYITEAAHVGLQDDYPVINGLTSLTANRDAGHRILESTPNGRRGFFHDIYMEATINQKQKFKIGPNGYYPMFYDYKIGVKYGVISKKFIQLEKKNPKIDFAQEYEGQFTSTYNAALPPLEQQNFTDTTEDEFQML